MKMRDEREERAESEMRILNEVVADYETTIQRRSTADRDLKAHLSHKIYREDLKERGSVGRVKSLVKDSQDLNFRILEDQQRRHMKSKLHLIQLREVEKQLERSWER